MSKHTTPKKPHSTRLYRNISSFAFSPTIEAFMVLWERLLVPGITYDRHPWRLILDAIHCSHIPDCSLLVRKHEHPIHMFYIYVCEACACPGVFCTKFETCLIISIIAALEYRNDGGISSPPFHLTCRSNISQYVPVLCDATSTAFVRTY